MIRPLSHVERKDKSDWVSACRELQVEGTNGKGKGRKTWNECVKVNMKKLFGQGGCSLSR